MWSLWPAIPQRARRNSSASWPLPAPGPSLLVGVVAARHWGASQRWERDAAGRVGPGKEPVWPHAAPLVFRSLQSPGAQASLSCRAWA